MAALNPARALQEELFCPICLDYFAEPVILNCEHNFCRACINTYWHSLDDSFPCPQCRKRCRKGKLRPNAQLGKVAEKARELAAAGGPALPKTPTLNTANNPKSAAGGEMCKQHLEALKLFCKNDEALICVVCDRSKEHRLHMVIPVEEAAEEYKLSTVSSACGGQGQRVETKRAQFQHYLATFKSERDSRDILAINQRKRLKTLLGRAEAVQQQTACVFLDLRKTLQDRESYIFQGLSKVTNDLKQMQQANESKIQQGSPLLRSLILELEQKCQQPHAEFLKSTLAALIIRHGKKSWQNRTIALKIFRHIALIQDFCREDPGMLQQQTIHKDVLEMDVGSLLNRCQSWSFLKWAPVSTIELEERISHFSHKKTALQEHMTEMREILTLDPDSAHPSLAISANRKTASRKDVCPAQCNTSKRFYPSFCVLGSEGFTRGRHHWLVDVRGQCGWALGVAQESVDRKKPVVLRPECGIWAVELGPYQLFPAAPASEEETEISTRRVLVSLDYEGGRLTFSDSQDPEPLFTLRASFREKLYPFFWLWSPEASITLCS